MPASTGGVLWNTGLDKIIGDGSNHYIAINTSGTEAMRIVSSGSVGIGTMAPSATLHVNGNVRISSGSAVFITIGPSTDGQNLITTNNGPLRINQNVADNVYLVGGNSGGKVAINLSTSVAPNANLEVSGTISATNLVVNGVSITGATASTDRIVSGSINAIADVSSGAVRISGTLALNNTGNEPCDAAHYYTFRANPVTQRLEMCRP
ncbi:hypothetical protein ACVW1C_002297 [Bradyrhizobium sp. USDA 4011]